MLTGPKEEEEVEECIGLIWLRIGKCDGLFWTW
jgi:hypothetical protein